MVGGIIKGMCYMDGMCFAMLTPMLYISICRRICGVIRGKGLARVLMMSSIALDQVYRRFSARGMPHRATHISAIANFPIFMVHVERRFEGVFMRSFGDPSDGIVHKWF